MNDAAHPSATGEASDAATRGFVRGTARDRGCEHVAKFLLLTGNDAAAQVLPHLSSAEVTGIARQVAATSSVEKREAFRILEEFGYPMATRELYVGGGAAAARTMLQAAFGEERAEHLLAPVPEAPQPAPGNLRAERALLQAKAPELRPLLDKRSDRQLALALAGASVPVARHLRACLTPQRGARIEAHAADVAGVLAAERGGAVQALVEQLDLQAPAGAEGAMEC